MQNKSLKSKMEPLAWLFQIITAIFLVFFLSVHLIIVHAYGINNILFQQILLRLQNPWWMAFYIAFVVSVVYHGINGLRGIIIDIGIKKKKALNSIFWIITIILIGYGIWLLFNIR